MTIIPVLDVRGGLAVRADARAGGRGHYPPVRGRLHDGPDPIDLARAYRDRLGLSDLYLADLDALAGAPPALPLVRDLARLGMRVWVDAGVRDAEDLPPLLEAGASVVVLGLETLRGPDALSLIVARFGPGAIAFGLDLRDGRPLVETETAWGSSDPIDLAAAAVARGARRILVLDLGRVGRGKGVGTLPLIARLTEAHRGIALVAGGGVAGPMDLAELEAAGASAALIGSALHDGRIGPGRGLESR